MTIAAEFLADLDAEMRTTRALLERVPDDKAAWKPHERSMSLSQLAIHIPGLVSWIPAVVAESELDVTGPASKGLMVRWDSATAMMATFDAALAAGRAALANASDELLREDWTLRAGAHVITTLPRIAVLRRLVLHHLIHHRGQLSVYLRLNDIPLPDIYGPTADSVR